ncbi:hypothetical protein Tco_1368649 [Tanacetum coccineum]
MAGLLFNKYKGDRVRVLLVQELREMLQALGEIMMQVKQWLLSVTTVRAQESVQVLDEEQLAFLADPGIIDDCDDISSAKAVLMANLSSYDSNVLSELNKLSKDFGKCFVPQMQLSTEQAFWLSIANPKSEQLFVTQTLVEIEVPKELPKHSMLNAHSELIFVKCNACMFDANHDLCVLEFVNDVNVRSKSKSSKRSKTKIIWKPTSKVFTDNGYRWKPTGQTFTMDDNTCPLTRITSTKVVPLKETTSKSVITQNPAIKVYSRRTKVTKSVGSSSKSKILESRISNNSESNQSWGSNASNIPSSSLIDFMLSKLFSGI